MTRVKKIKNATTTILFVVIRPPAARFSPSPAIVVGSDPPWPCPEGWTGPPFHAGEATGTRVELVTPVRELVVTAVRASTLRLR